jgi:hypothetical protein
MAASNRSVARNYVRQFAFPAGYALTIPKINVPTAVSTGTDRHTSGGDDEGQAIATVTINTTGPSLVPTFAHATYQIPFTARNEVSRNAGMWLGAMKAAAAQAIAVHQDAAILALYSGFSGTPVDATAALNWDAIVEARQALEDNNAPGPYTLFLHSKQYTAALGIAEVKAALGLGASANFGASPIEHSGIWLPSLDLRIVFTGNVAQTGGEDKNLMISGEAIGLAFIDELRMEEEHSVRVASDFLMTYSDYGVGELHDGYGITLRTTTP